MTPAHTLTLPGVLSQSKLIITAHSRHFLALSLLFLLPLSTSIILFPTIYPPNHHQSDVVSSHHTLNTSQTLIHPLIHTIVVYVFSICALASITYSTFHGFYGRPVKFLPSIKSIVYSFFPIVSTAIAVKFLVSLIVVAFLMFVFVVIKVIIKLGQTLGFVTVTVLEIDYNSTYFLSFCVVIGGVLTLIMIYLQVIWGLASVIAITESKWWFEPLRRSSYLTTGMRSVSVSLFVVYGILISLWVWMATNSVSDFDIVGDWKSWEFVLQTVISSSFLGFFTVLMLHYTAANTVLYMYCKALHGELAIEIAREFASEYVCLPFDDEKVPHVVTVVSA